jgi:hypothetical protein
MTRALPWALRATGQARRSVATRVAVLVGLLLAARTAAAQTGLSGGVALELGGVHAGEFRDRAKDAFSAALDFRVAQFGETSLLVGVRAEEPVLEGDLTTICIVGSHGQCLDPPPSLRAATVNVGVRRYFMNRIAIEADVGAGGFAAGQWSGWRGAESASVDFALRIAGPLYTEFGGHLLVWSYGGAALRAQTVTYGLRIN